MRPAFTQSLLRCFVGLPPHVTVLRGKIGAERAISTASVAAGGGGDEGHAIHTLEPSEAVHGVSNDADRSREVERVHARVAVRHAGMR